MPAKWPSVWQVASSPGGRSFMVSREGEGFDLFSQMSLWAMEPRRNQNLHKRREECGTRKFNPQNLACTPSGAACVLQNPF